MIHLHAWWTRIYKHALLLLPEKFCGLHKPGAVPLLIACAYAVVLTSWQGIEGPKMDQVLTRSLKRAISTMLGVSFAILTTSHLRSQIPCHHTRSIKIELSLPEVSNGRMQVGPS
jgi:energy-converting hydrogenase Eha subunit E